MQVRSQVTPQVSPLAQVNTLAQPTHTNSFPPPPYFSIPFPPPVPPSNASIAPSAPASDLSAAISLMTNAVNQGNANTTNITDALQKTTTQFADALQKTIQRGVEAQAEENRNARLDKQFDKIKTFDGSNPSECHPWLEEVHALCSQTGRPFKEMLLLCAGQAVRDFILDMAPDAMDEQIKNDLITGYSDLQGLGCKQAAYDNIAQRPEEPVRSYIVRYSRLFKLLNGTAPNEVRMRTTSMHFVNSLRGYLSSKVENRLLGMNERNYSLDDTFAVALQCELKAIASERRHNKRNTITINNVHTEDQDYRQLEDTQEVHVRNPNYKGKNYDPNYQARKAEGKQQPQLETTNNQYKAPAARPAANHNNDLARSSDIAGEVTLKTTVDGYQLLKMNELIKNAAAWRARMPKTNRFDKYFGVNSPEPATSEQSVPVAQPSSSVDRDVQAAKKQQPSPCMPTIVNYEPPSFNLQIPKRMFTRSERDQVLQNHMTAANTTFNKVAVLEDLMRQEPHNAAHYKEVQHIQKNQHIQVAVKLQHMLEADNEFRQTAGLPQLDLPEHLWTARNMDTAPVREQHFMAISSEIEVLRQQLKGKGVYPAPPNYTQINQQNVHFQPIQPAKLSPLQPQDRLFFDPLLSTTTGSTGSQSDSAHDPTQDCNSTPPKVHTPSPRIPEPTIPPTPYVNQAAVEQHIRTQSPSVPPRNIATIAPPPRESPQASFAQETLITLATSQITPPQAQNQLTTSPQRPRKSKSKDGRGIKQSKNVNTTDTAQVCWRCGEPGHKK